MQIFVGEFREKTKKSHPKAGFLRIRGSGLLTDTELLNNSTVALNVFSLEVIQQAATLTYQVGQCTLGVEVLAVLLEVLGKVVDTEGEQGDLALCSTGVLGVVAILSKELSFLLRC